MVLTFAVVMLTVANTRIRQALTARNQARIELQEQQIKTETAERDKTWETALSHWKEARMARESRQPGQRWRSLEALTAAVQELRLFGPTGSQAARVAR